MHHSHVHFHAALKVTPAMVANVTPMLMEMSDMVKVVNDWEEKNACISSRR